MYNRPIIHIYIDISFIKEVRLHTIDIHLQLKQDKFMDISPQKWQLNNYLFKYTLINKSLNINLYCISNINFNHTFYIARNLLKFHFCFPKCIKIILNG